MLTAGNIVTDLDPESRFEGKQGLVLNVQLCFWTPPEVLVGFDPKFDIWYLNTWEDRGEKYVKSIYRPDELQLDENWSPQIQVERIFGKRYNSINVLKAKLDPQKRCMIDECDHKQKEVVWINIWGSVMNAYVCEAHGKYYRYWCCMDTSPLRPPWKEKKTG